MRFCPNCNHQVPEEASACPRCGARLPVRAGAQPVVHDGESLPDEGFFVPDAAVLDGGPAEEATKPLPAYAQNTLRPEETKPVPDPTKIPAAPFVLPKDKVLLPKSEMARINAASPADASREESAPNGQAGKKEKKSKKRQSLGIMLPLVVLVLIVGLVGAVYLLYRNELYGLPAFPGKKDDAVPAAASEAEARDWTVFISDGDLYFLDVGLGRKLLLAEDVANAGVFAYENGDAVFSDGQNAVKALGENVLLGKDGKTLVYPVTVTPQGTSLLYVRDLSDPTSAPSRLAENVKTCALSSDCTILTWQDGAGRLRQTEIQSGHTTLVSDDAPDGFAVSDDGRHVTFCSSGNELVSYVPGRPNEVAAKNVSAVFFVSDTLVYYLNHSRGLYRFDGQNTERLSDGVTEVCKVYPDGGIYYLKDNGDKLILSDFIEDDLAGADAAIARPQKPTAPLFKDYPSLGAYNAAFDAYERAYKTYEEKQKAYEEKLARDELRLGLGQSKWVKELLTLCYYDGETATNVSERVDLSAPRAFSEHEPAATFMQILPAAGKKLLFSEIGETIDPETATGQILTRYEKCCAAVGKAVYEIGDVSDVPDAMDYAGNTLYFRKTSGGALCCVTFDKDGKKGAVTRLAGNTDFFAASPASGYWVAFSGGSDGVIAGQMLFAGRLTETNVCPASVRFVDGGIAYLSDCAKNADGVYTGTLRFCDGETVTTLATDVRMFCVSSNGTFLCLRSPAADGGTLLICGVGEVKNTPVSVLPSPDGAPLFARWSPLADDRDRD